jgi:hypothetical protein
MTPAVCQLAPTQQAGRDVVMRGPMGEIVTLNLPRLREAANYGATPEPAPSASISGAEAFERYIQHMLPIFRDSGGELPLLGPGEPWLIGPASACLDLAARARQRSVQSFLAFTQRESYLAGIGRRTAAIVDAWLSPLSGQLWGIAT